MFSFSLGLQNKFVFNEELVEDEQSSWDQDKTFRVDQEYRRKGESEGRQLYSANGEDTRSGDEVVDWNPEVVKAKSELQQRSLPPAVSQDDEHESRKNEVAGLSNECDLSISGLLSKSNGIQTANKLCVSQQGRKSISELRLKGEPEALQLSSANATRVKIEPSQKCEEKINPVIISVVSVSNSDLSLEPGVSQSQELTGLELESSCLGRLESKNTHNNFRKRNISLTDDRHHDEFKNKSKVPEKEGSCGKTLELLSHGTVLQPKTSRAAKRPYVSQERGKSFSKNVQLNKHKRTQANSERQHPCITCGKGYLTKSHLTRHMKIHSSERPHVCPICGRGFKQSSHLRGHIVRHMLKSQ